jgi:hypothetical protein
MNAAKSVTATFTNQPVLTVSISGNGHGTVMSNPSGINCDPSNDPCLKPFPEGTTVTLTADPDNTDSTFGGWTGPNAGACMALTCQVTMNGDRAVTATFILKQYTLHVSTTGNGTVTGNGINCGTGTTDDCDQVYDHGTPVSLDATPGTPMGMVTWGLACASAPDNTCTLIIDGPKFVSADFS